MRPAQLLLPAAVLLAGCGEDPLAADIADYHARLSPILTTNQAMSQQFLELTRGLKDETLDADDIAARWRDQIIPQAEELRAEAVAIEPRTAELQDLHSQLTFAWTERAEAYRQMYEAFEGRQPEAFKSAFARNLDAKRTEEQYFNQVNALLQPYDLKLTLYQ